METTSATARIARRRWWAEFIVGAVLFGVVIASTLLTLGRTAQTPPLDAPRPGFWDLLHVDGASYAWFDSLQEMADMSTVVITGQIESVAPGRVFDPEPQFGERSKAYYLAATVRVDKVLHGALAEPGANTITVELFVTNKEAIPAVIASTPTSMTSVFFLLNKAEHPATAALPARQRAAEAKYYEIMGEQARFERVGTKVSIAAEISPEEFPGDLAGVDFNAFLAKVEALE